MALSRLKPLPQFVRQQGQRSGAAHVGGALAATQLLNEEPIGDVFLAGLYELLCRYRRARLLRSSGDAQPIMNRFWGEGARIARYRCNCL